MIPSRFYNTRPSGAYFGPDDRYRYSLWRQEICNDTPDNLLVVIGLNPSTATETVDDPTIRRCRRFAYDWGYRGLVMLNLFAYRAADPLVMKGIADPVGPDNDNAMAYFAREGGMIVAAWGNHGSHLGRSAYVRKWFADESIPLYHLGLTKTGEPKHPLYLRADTIPSADWSIPSQSATNR